MLIKDRYIDFFTDFGFKKLFGSDEDKDNDKYFYDVKLTQQKTKEVFCYKLNFIYIEMTKIIHNAILQRCIMHLQKTMQQSPAITIIYTYDPPRCSSRSASGIARTPTQTADTYNNNQTCSVGSMSQSHTTYNYDAPKYSRSPGRLSTPTTTYTYNTNHPKSNTGISPVITYTYTYDPLCNHTILLRSTSYGEQAKPNNTSTNTPPSYNHPPERLPQNTTYDTTIYTTTTHTPFAKITHVLLRLQILLPPTRTLDKPRSDGRTWRKECICFCSQFNN